jgi:hypothetical protein
MAEDRLWSATNLPLSPTADEIRVELERVIASATFRTKPQLASFLRFVVEATLAGRSDRIKGYTIAVEAFGRDTNFDPQADAIVRVEAGRLRKALEGYYAAPGRRDQVTIGLQRGSYVPTFVRCRTTWVRHFLTSYRSHIPQLVQRSIRPVIFMACVAAGISVMLFFAERVVASGACQVSGHGSLAETDDRGQRK